MYRHYVHVFEMLYIQNVLRCEICVLLVYLQPVHTGYMLDRCRIAWTFRDRHYATCESCKLGMSKTEKGDFSTKNNLSSEFTQFLV